MAFAESEDRMRLALVSIALAAGLALPVAAEPAPSLLAFLFGARSAQEAGEATASGRSGSDSRDVLVVDASDGVRPAARPAEVSPTLRTARVERRIARTPWVTGVYQ